MTVPLICAFQVCQGTRGKNRQFPRMAVRHFRQKDGSLALVTAPLLPASFYRNIPAPQFFQHPQIHCLHHIQAAVSIGGRNPQKLGLPASQQIHQSQPVIHIAVLYSKGIVTVKYDFLHLHLLPSMFFRHSPRLDTIPAWAQSPPQNRTRHHIPFPAPYPSFHIMPEQHGPFRFHGQSGLHTCP